MIFILLFILSNFTNIFFIFQVCSVKTWRSKIVQEDFCEHIRRRKLDLIQWPLSSSIYFGRKIGRNRFQVYENH